MDSHTSSQKVVRIFKFGFCLFTMFSGVTEDFPSFHSWVPLLWPIVLVHPGAPTYLLSEGSPAQHLPDIMRQAQTGAVPRLTVKLGNETLSSRLNAQQLPPALAWSFQLTLLRPNFCYSMSLALARPCSVLLASDSGPDLILSPHGLDPCGYPMSSLV